MDRRLFDAARTGNVENLLNMINNDPLMLHSVTLAGAETPLHIACMTGHLDFVKEIMKFRREFVEELNQDGLSPLHIASACGHTEIVKELLEAGGTNLCLIKGRERRIALHYSVIKGKVQIIKELLSANIDSVAEVTTRGETALHLAVKNNQFESFSVMVEHLKEFNKEDVLNIKDDSGNTILHLAVSRKQYEVVDLVLNRDLICRGVVEVNSLNESGLTPMDVSLLFQSEAGDREIEEILLRAGAMRSGEMHSLVQTTVRDQINAGNNPSNNQSITEPSRATFRRLFPRNIKDSSTQEHTTLLAIALFIATMTYQSVFSPPGGVWQQADVFRVISPMRIIAGQAVMCYNYRFWFAVFQIFSISGFVYSMLMIIILTHGIFMHWALKVLVFALAVTYCRGMDAIACEGSKEFLCMLTTLIGSITIVLLSIWYFLRRSRNALSLTDQVRATTEWLLQRLHIWTSLLNDFLTTRRRLEQRVGP